MLLNETLTLTQEGKEEPKTLKLLKEAITPDSFKDPVIALLSKFTA